LDGFKKRISRAFWDGPNKRPKNEKETRNWVVGEDGRSLGSLHSDWWTGTAATLARSGNIVVYPVTGWWRERTNQHKYNNSTRYCLLVSISSRKKTLDLYTPSTSIGTVQTEIMEECGLPKACWLGEDAAAVRPLLDFAVRHLAAGAGTGEIDAQIEHVTAFAEQLVEDGVVT
jgi:hypothetical protein